MRHVLCSVAPRMDVGCQYVSILRCSKKGGYSFHYHWLHFAILLSALQELMQWHMYTIHTLSYLPTYFTVCIKLRHNY